MILNKNVLLFDLKSCDGPETYLVKDAQLKEVFGTKSC